MLTSLSTPLVRSQVQVAWCYLSRQGTGLKKAICAYFQWFVGVDKKNKFILPLPLLTNSLTFLRNFSPHWLTCLNRQLDCNLPACKYLSRRKTDSEAENGTTCRTPLPASKEEERKIFSSYYEQYIYYAIRPAPFNFSFLLINKRYHTSFSHFYFPHILQSKIFLQCVLKYILRFNVYIFSFWSSKKIQQVIKIQDPSQ